MLRRATAATLEERIAKLEVGASYQALPTLERCADLQALRSEAEPPEAVTTGDAVEAVRTELAEVKILLRAGTCAQAEVARLVFDIDITVGPLRRTPRRRPPSLGIRELPLAHHPLHLRTNGARFRTSPDQPVSHREVRNRASLAGHGEIEHQEDRQSSRRDAAEARSTRTRPGRVVR